MTPLPVARITPHVVPFTFTGIDFFGPLMVSMGVRGKRLGANLQHRSVLLVPQHLIKQILTDAHGHFLSGHFGISKTKHRLLQNVDVSTIDWVVGCAD